MHYTEDEYYQGLIPTEEVRNNAIELIKRVNLLAELLEERLGYKLPPVLISGKGGLRSLEDNESVKGVNKSPHLTGEAIDICDPEYIISRAILNNLDLLEKVDLYMENPYCTTSKTITKMWNGMTFMNNWIHLQTRKASVRVFNP